MCICVPWAMAPTRWNDRRPLRTQPQRADAPGQPDVLPAGLAERQKQGRAAKDIAPEVIEKALVKASTEKTMRKAIEDGMMVTDAFAKFGVL